MVDRIKHWSPGERGLRWGRWISRAWTIWLVMALWAGMLPVDSVRAEASVTQLSWRHPDPETVSHFDLWMAFSPEEKLAPAQVPVGKPVEGDHYSWGVTLDDQTSVWVAVVAIGLDGQRSEPSEWRRIDWQPGQAPLKPPGRPYLVKKSR